MKWYIAAWQDPYTKEAKSLMFGVKDGKIVKTSPYMPWAKGRPVPWIKRYFNNNGAAFYEVKKNEPIQ